MVNKNGCIFCQIAQKKSKADIKFENDDVMIFSNINPAADTHLLVIPKKHIETFLELDSEMLIKMHESVQKIIEDIHLENAYKLLFNGGRYQAVPHVHWHLMAGKMKKGIKT